jgi:hypothetical protein
MRVEIEPAITEQRELYPTTNLRHLRFIHDASGPVWRQDTFGNALPIARRDREKTLPDARWRTRFWRTQGAAQRQLQAWPVHPKVIASRRWLRRLTRDVRALTKRLGQP